jgi:transcriptional regulator with XRE-family HTH domain
MDRETLHRLILEGKSWAEIGQIFNVSHTSAMQLGHNAWGTAKLAELKQISPYFIYQNRFGLRLRQLRAEAGLSLREVANCMSSLNSPQGVGRLEKGQQTPKKESVEELCELFGGHGLRAAYTQDREDVADAIGCVITKPEPVEEEAETEDSFPMTLLIDVVKYFRKIDRKTNWNYVAMTMATHGYSVEADECKRLFEEHITEQRIKNKQKAEVAELQSRVDFLEGRLKDVEGGLSTIIEAIEAVRDACS